MCIGVEVQEGCCQRVGTGQTFLLVEWGGGGGGSQPDRHHWVSGSPAEAELCRSRS
jgi:hypothetical protein